VASTIPKVTEAPKGLSPETIARNEAVLRAKFLKSMRKQKTTLPEIRKELESQWDARIRNFRHYCKTKRMLKRRGLSEEELIRELAPLVALIERGRMEWEVVGDVYDEMKEKLKK
jgi:hypothetical protein